MKKGRCIAAIPVALLLLTVASCAGGPRRHEARPPKIEIDPGQRYQAIEHFGVSAAWWAQDLGAWPAAALDPVLDLLFDRKKGIGLTLVRYNLGGGRDSGSIADPWRSASSVLLPDGSLDWSRDAAAIAVVDGAVARGARVLAFCNSPPASMTVTGSAEGAGRQCNLRPDAQAAFARYLADCAVELGRRWPLVAISPANEPQWDWSPRNGQEGCHYEPSQLHALAASLVAEFSARGIATPISLVDSGSWETGRNRPYIEALLADPLTRPLLSTYALHSYWSKAGDRRALRGWLDISSPATSIWMSEWTELREGRDRGMGAALTLARTIDEDLVIGGVSSWQYWIAVSKYDYADGLLYLDGEGHSVLETKKLWVLGNWSRHIAPGSRRVRCSVAEGGGLSASAFVRPDGSVVLVVINGSDRPSAPTSISVAGGTGSEGRAYETSEGSDLGEVPFAPVAQVFAARSVTTIIAAASGGG